ncbi:MAG: hypothetical protein R3C60_00950 [Parvularculaceae bacterium]
MKKNCILGALLLAFSNSAAASSAIHENGVGSDPDGDTNPATRTYAVVNINANDVRLDQRFKIIDFEPPGGNGDTIKRLKKYGVTFERPVIRQICRGQRYFRYDSMCTYYAPASGAYAAYYRDDWGRPLAIRFDKPVCAFAVSLYPIGGREEEEFEAKIRGWTSDGVALKPARIKFTWSQNVLKWHVMAGAFFLDRHASRVEIELEGKKSRSNGFQFLIDDAAYAEDHCNDLLDYIKDESGFTTSSTGKIDSRK